MVPEIDNAVLSVIAEVQVSIRITDLIKQIVTGSYLDPLTSELAGQGYYLLMPNICDILI